jgi:hypothetical protein
MQLSFAPKFHFLPNALAAAAFHDGFLTALTGAGCVGSTADFVLLDAMPFTGLADPSNSAGAPAGASGVVLMVVVLLFAMLRSCLIAGW